MRVRHAALLAALGLFCSFSVKTLGTLMPDLFVSGSVALTGVVIQLLAGLALVWFLIVFLQGLASGATAGLRRATGMALLGSVVALLPEIQGLLRLLGVAPFSPWLQWDSLELAARWIAVAGLTVFFIVLLQAAKRAGDDWLARGARAGIVGSAALLIMASLTVAGYVGSRVIHGPSLLPLFLTVAVPLVVIGFLATLFFFVTVYRHPPWMLERHPAPGL